MKSPILYLGLGIIFTLAGTKYPDSPSLFVIAAAAFVSAVYFYHQKRKTAQKDKEETHDKIDEAR